MPLSYLFILHVHVKCHERRRGHLHMKMFSPPTSKKLSTPLALTIIYSHCRLKHLILVCFLLVLHKNLELEHPGSELAEQSTEGLGLSSVIRSLRHSGYMGLNLITRPVCRAKMLMYQLCRFIAFSMSCMQKGQPTKGNNALYLALLLLCAGDIEINPGPTNIITCKFMHNSLSPHSSQPVNIIDWLNAV